MADHDMDDASTSYYAATERLKQLEAAKARADAALAAADEYLSRRLHDYRANGREVPEETRLLAERRVASARREAAAAAAAVAEAHARVAGLAGRLQRPAAGQSAVAVTVAGKHRTLREQQVYLARVVRWLSFIELFVPARLRNEEIGDALEVIFRIVTDAQPGWRVQVALKFISTVFWVAINSIRHIAASLLGKKSTSNDSE